jgi:hypothetical protein
VPDPAPANRYRKLPGVAANPLGRTRLWEGSDHLLVVTSVAAFETYRRFYFREIKALIVQRNRVGRVWNAVLGVLTGLCVAGALGFSALTAHGRFGDFIAGVVIMFIFAALVAAVLIVNIARGPTCTVYVQSGAGVERLGAPARLRLAHRLRERIAPKIRAAQGASAEPVMPPTVEAPAGAASP